MKNLIILGTDFSNILEFRDPDKVWTFEQNTFIHDHTFTCKKPYIWIFGQKIDSWIEFNPDLKIRPDDIAYIQRTLIEETERILGIRLNNLKIIGITVNEN